MPFDELASDEWRAGYLAFGDGLAHHDNPYSAALDPDKFSAWRDGYNEAEDDRGDESDEWWIG